MLAIFLYVRKTIEEWVFGWHLGASWAQSSDDSSRFGRRCLLRVCCGHRDGDPRQALYGPRHIDEQLYRPELCSALGAHSLLNQWANQSILAHTQATAEPLSGPSSLTVTPAQVAGDTLIHLSQAQTDSSHHILAISTLSISPSLTRSVTQTHFLSSVSLSPFVSHTVSFSLYLCTHPFPCRCISLFPDPSLNPPPHPKLSPRPPCSHHGCLPVWPRETELWSNWHTHHCLSISALNEGWNDWELELFWFASPSFRLGLQRLITKSFCRAAQECLKISSVSIIAIWKWSHSMQHTSQIITEKQALAADWDCSKAADSERWQRLSLTASWKQFADMRAQRRHLN